MPPLRFYTGRLAGAATPRNSYDITIKSGDARFAPTWALLRQMLEVRWDPVAHERLWPWYRQQYLGLLRQRYGQDRRLFEPLLERMQGPEPLHLCCYCANPGRCHRTLLAWALCHVGTQWAGEPRPPGRKALAISGSRAHPDPHGHLWQCLNGLAFAGGGDWLYVVHGAAEGVDQAAEEWGRQYSTPIALPCEKRNWKRYGRGYGQVRNDWILAATDVLVALPYGEARGTRGAIVQAKARGMECHVFEYQER